MSGCVDRNRISYKNSRRNSGSVWHVRHVHHIFFQTFCLENIAHTYASWTNRLRGKFVPSGVFIVDMANHIRSSFIMGFGFTKSKSIFVSGLTVFIRRSRSIGTRSHFSIGPVKRRSDGGSASTSSNAICPRLSSRFVVVTSLTTNAYSIFSRDRNLSMHAKAALKSQRSPSGIGFSTELGLMTLKFPSMKLEHSDQNNGLDETGTPAFANSTAKVVAHGVLHVHFFGVERTYCLCKGSRNMGDTGFADEVRALRHEIILDAFIKGER